MGYWTDAKFTGLGGGLPITLQDKHIGAIGISGLSESEDEQVAYNAINKLIL
jgi:glc operon protein GlcG